MATDRHADVTWHGSLIEGSGTIDSVGSGAFAPLDVTWASRAEEPAGRTSPEELIAAAHAACFAMALSHELAGAGTPPDELKTGATVTFQPGEGITKVALTARGSRPRRGRLPRGGRSGEARLPGLTGPRGSAGDRARRGACLSPRGGSAKDGSGARCAERRRLVVALWLVRRRDA